jgi:hypothetical protein
LTGIISGTELVELEVEIESIELVKLIILLFNAEVE